MTTLETLLDPHQLTTAIDAGHIRQQQHPTEPLAILNYTEVCAYENAWTPATLACRGLIYRTDTREVAARPFPKFFNHGQPGAATIPLDSPVSVIDKLDGCFPEQTALNLWGGGTVTIGEVVRKRLPVTLVGMSEDGELVPTLVTDWHHNGRKDHWLDIEIDAPVSRTSGAGGHSNRLRVTVNHHILVNGEYRPACDIRPADIVVTQTWQPSEDVIRLVRASLLGDGCLVTSATEPCQARYQEPHTAKHAEYVLALRKALGDCAATRANTVSGTGSTLMWTGSHEYEALGHLRDEWYPGGVKRVPSDLSWLDDFAVAKWLMDDGHRQHFTRQADRIAFATHSFPRSDIIRLGDRLAELYGISYHLVKDGPKGTDLVVTSGRQQQIRNLWMAVAPHIHPSMRDTLPEEFRDVPYQEIAPGWELVVPRDVVVRSVAAVEADRRNFPHGRTGYDITTTTHNYLARGVLVHNSLGIVYPTRSGHAVATRGSFASDQAQHATRLLHNRYGDWCPPPGYTPLFEIVYPENRIVCDYGDLDDLIFLGAVEIATGEVHGPEVAQRMGWRGRRADVFEAATLADALAMMPRPNAEGVVVRDIQSGAMIKIKQDDYVALHKIVTGLNARVIWQHLIDGKPLDELVAPLPDEFHPWCHQVAAQIEATVEQRAVDIEKAYTELCATLPDGFGRKEFAAAAVPHPLKWALFLMLDGRDPRRELWRRAKPEPFLTPSGRTYGEDTA